MTEERAKVFSKGLVDALFRAFLRTMPILPVPELYDVLKQMKGARTKLGDKVEAAANSLRVTSELVEELQVELQHRTERLEHLRGEYEKYSKLAEIEEDKAKAIIKQLSTTLSKGRSRERLIGFGLNILAGIGVFVLGVVLSPWLRRLLGLE